MHVWLHAEYRQFGHVRKSGETIAVPDAVGAGMVAKGQACPVVDGVHQCQLLTTISGGQGDYLNGQMDAPANVVMVPTKWSRQKRLKLQAAAHRSRAVRAAIKGKRWDQISPKGLW